MKLVSIYETGENKKVRVILDMTKEEVDFYLPKDLLKKQAALLKQMLYPNKPAKQWNIGNE